MLRTLSRTRDLSLTYRLAGIAVFTILTILSARITIEIGPVPFTLQPLAVLLAGLVLGARDGFASQALYIALIAAGAPLDARGLGTAAFAGPTAGYLIGFVFAAGTAGFLVEHGAKRVWQRWLAGIVGVGIIYLFGVLGLHFVVGLDWDKVWAAGVAPFIVPDLLKALIAAALAEGGRRFLLQ